MWFALLLVLAVLVGLLGCWLMIRRVGVNLGEDETKKFACAVLLPYLFATILLGIPIYNQATHRDLQPQLKTNVDMFCTLAGLLGFYLCGVLSLFHRRLTALERLLAAKNQQS